MDHGTIPTWPMFVIGALAIVAGGVTQQWSLLCFGVGLAGTSTIVTTVMEDREHNRKA